MATLEQEKEVREKLGENLAELVAIDPESLARTTELGTEVNFEAGVPVFRRTLELFRDLAECDLEGVPFEVLNNQLNAQVTDARNRFKQIQEFSITAQPDPKGTRDNLIGQLAGQWNAYWTALTPVITSRKQRAIDFDQLEREARGVVSTQKDVVTELRTEKDKVLAEMRGALEQVRKAAAEAGVAQHAGLFKDEADANRKQAWWWLGAAVAFAVATIAYALVWVTPHLTDLPADVSTSRIVGLTLSKVLVISVLSSGIFWCARNFSALRHNFIINRHRQNALGTFETFAKAAGDTETKNAVLLQATLAIFAPQASGYSREDAQPQQQARLVEIVRGLADRTE